MIAMKELHYEKGFKKRWNLLKSEKGSNDSLSPPVKAIKSSFGDFKY